VNVQKRRAEKHVYALRVRKRIANQAAECLFLCSALRCVPRSYFLSGVFIWLQFGVVVFFKVSVAREACAAYDGETDRGRAERGGLV